MALLGNAILAVWNEVEPDIEDDFNEWYLREHIPERTMVVQPEPTMLWSKRRPRSASRLGYRRRNHGVGRRHRRHRCH